jgi:hypothetical protein
MMKTLKCSSCPALIYQDSKTGYCLKCYKARIHPTRLIQEPKAQVAQDREKGKHQAEVSSLKLRYAESLKTIERQESELRAMNVLGQNLDTFEITPKLSKGTAEGTVVMVASDWHLEESVGAEVGGLNIFNLDIAKQRTERFFQAGLRLIQLLQQDIKIDTVVLALLGDFITNNIHEECADVSELAPMHAITLAKGHLISGITFLLEHSDFRLVLPCHSGNHARTTKTTRFSAENGHSLEYLMYLSLADYFRNEPRVQFIIPEGAHSYLKVYDTTIRFQHGHMIKYGGGVGGIYIPVNKAIAQWDRARKADLNVFGHFHQLVDGGNFICNGSLIGYNAFALSIKASYEPPKQALFLLDKRRGRTCSWPIILEEKA